MGVCTSRQKFATLAAGTDYLASRVLCIEIDAARENLVSLHSEGCHLRSAGPHRALPAKAAFGRRHPGEEEKRSP
jgi:hypothetical protein